MFCGRRRGRLDFPRLAYGLITDIAICLIAAWVLAVGFNAFKQPVLLAYLVAGFALGPHGFGWVTDEPSIATVADMGLILLLFMIGLEIDLRKMLASGRAITVTAGAQIFGSALLGLLFCRFAGLAGSWLESLHLGVAVALSSTVIIVKLLHDKRELETLPGRITLGVLVLQDLFAIVFLALQPNLQHPSAGLILISFGRVGLLMLVAFVVSRYLLPPIFKSVARLPELVLVGALAWCFALAGLANLLGLSREMGALVAGVAISTFPYTLDVAAKVTSIRDFFVVLFFVTLGMTFPAPKAADLGWTLGLAAFVVATRAATVFVPLYLTRHGHRGSLLPTLNLSQLSELSLVILALGRTAGKVSDHAVAAVAFTFSLLAAGSTYAILGGDALTRRLSPWLTRLGLPDLDTTPAAVTSTRPPGVFLLGFSWTASSLLEEIRRERPDLLADLRVVDFNPVVHERLRHRGVSVVYGDITQRDVLLHAGIAGARIIICSLPNTVLRGATNLRLLQQVRQLNPEAQIIVHAERLVDVPALYAEGAHWVILPRLLEAGEIFAAIAAAEKKLLHEKRQADEAQLRQRDEVIP